MEVGGPVTAGWNDSRVAAGHGVSSASSRWYSASSAISGARCSRTPRPRRRSSRGPNCRCLLDQVALGLDAAGRRRGSSGSASSASTITRAWARFTVAGTQRLGGLGPPRRRARQPTRVTGVRSRAPPGSGSPATSRSTGPGRVGHVVGGREHPQPFGLGRADDPRQIRSRSSCFSAGRSGTPGRSQRARPATRSTQVERGGVGAGHRASQAPTTDTSSGSETFVHRGNLRVIWFAWTELG